MIISSRSSGGTAFAASYSIDRAALMKCDQGNYRHRASG